MRHPRTWPPVVYCFLLVVIGSVAFPTFLDFMAGQPPDYYTAVPLLVLAVGIALFASRLCWWVLLVWGALALAYTGFRLLNGPFGPTDIGWPSWVNIILQTLLVVMLLTPAMLRWAAPFGRAKAAA